MKLYTKSGDDGSTGLFGGPRVLKCDPRVDAYGQVDETNAAIGVAICHCMDEEIAGRLKVIQADLFVIGAELATPQNAEPPHAISDLHISQLEKWIDESCGQTTPLRNFVLPGGSALAASLHLARTVCRRAERAVVALAQDARLRANIVIYLNRLSDLLFAWARLANHRAEVPDVPWIPSKP
jgi:cob(I)alamin adenosyltransferase